MLVIFDIVLVCLDHQIAFYKLLEFKIMLLVKLLDMYCLFFCNFGILFLKNVANNCIYPNINFCFWGVIYY